MAEFEVLAWLNQLKIECADECGGALEFSLPLHETLVAAARCCKCGCSSTLPTWAIVYDDENLIRRAIDDVRTVAKRTLEYERLKASGGVSRYTNPDAQRFPRALLRMLRRQRKAENK